MLAFAAGPTLDTGQQITYLYFFIAPFLFHLLFNVSVRRSVRLSLERASGNGPRRSGAASPLAGVSSEQRNQV